MGATVVPGVCKAGSGGRDVLTSSEDRSLVAMIRAGIMPQDREITERNEER